MFETVRASCNAPAHTLQCQLLGDGSYSEHHLPVRKPSSAMCNGRMQPDRVYVRLYEHVLHRRLIEDEQRVRGLALPVPGATCRGCGWTMCQNLRRHAAYTLRRPPPSPPRCCSYYVRDVDNALNQRNYKVREDWWCSGCRQPVTDLARTGGTVSGA